MCKNSSPIIAEFTLLFEDPFEFSLRLDKMSDSDKKGKEKQSETVKSVQMYNQN